VEGESSAKDLVNLFDYFNKLHFFDNSKDLDSYDERFPNVGGEKKTGLNWTAEDFCRRPRYMTRKQTKSDPLYRVTSAENEGITKNTADSMPEVSLFGPLHTEMFRLAVGSVGNNGETYARQAEGEVPRRGLNEVNPWPGGPADVPPSRDQRLTVTLSPQRHSIRVA